MRLLIDHGRVDVDLQTRLCRLRGHEDPVSLTRAQLAFLERLAGSFPGVVTLEEMAQALGSPAWLSYDSSAPRAFVRGLRKKLEVPADDSQNGIVTVRGVGWRLGGDCKVVTERRRRTMVSPREWWSTYGRPILLDRLVDHLAQSASDGQRIELVFVLGTSRVPVWGEGGVTRAARHTALAGDGLFLPQIAIAVCEQLSRAGLPAMQVKTLLDCDALPYLESINEDKIVHVVTCGMGNVNAVTREAFAAYTSTGGDCTVRPGPFRPETSTIMPVDAVANGPFQNGSCVGVLAALSNPWCERGLVIVAAGVDVMGTIGALRLLLELVATPEHHQQFGPGARVAVGLLRNHPVTKRPSRLVRAIKRSGRWYEESLGGPLLPPSDGTLALVGLSMEGLGVVAADGE